jgi:5-(carboxyamino)imidazole ribonucleotide synthase
MTPVPPGSTLGIVGGGQLGRMLAMAAAQLGYKCHIYAPDEAPPPAAEVAAKWTRGRWDDADALARFGREVDVATYEFENIDAAALDALASETLLRPPRRALEIAQDRLAEKNFVATLGGRPARFAPVSSREVLEEAIAAVGTPSILKTRRFGYDGKGQARLAGPGDADNAWQAVGGAPSVLEAFVPFDAEFSILLCRGADGETTAWPAPRNTHAGGILVRSQVPAAGIAAEILAEAEALTQHIAEALDYVGVLAAEYFATAKGPVFNEMAPRVHNSAHWTIEGAVTSQFENHVRAICGLPLGDTSLTGERVEMDNLIGDDANRWPDILREPGAHLHLYGKDAPRPGRKMGHVTRVTPLPAREG